MAWGTSFMDRMRQRIQEQERTNAVKNEARAFRGWAPRPWAALQATGQSPGQLNPQGRDYTVARLQEPTTRPNNWLSRLAARAADHAREETRRQNSWVRRPSFGGGVSAESRQWLDPSQMRGLVDPLQQNMSDFGSFASDAAKFIKDAKGRSRLLNPDIEQRRTYLDSKVQSGNITPEVAQFLMRADAEMLRQMRTLDEGQIQRLIEVNLNPFVGTGRGEDTFNIGPDQAAIAVTGPTSLTKFDPDYFAQHPDQLPGTVSHELGHHLLSDGTDAEHQIFSNLTGAAPNAAAPSIPFSQLPGAGSGAVRPLLPGLPQFNAPLPAPIAPPQQPQAPPTNLAALAQGFAPIGALERQGAMFRGEVPGAREARQFGAAIADVPEEQRGYFQTAAQFPEGVTMRSGPFADQPTTLSPENIIRYGAQGGMPPDELTTFLQRQEAGVTNPQADALALGPIDLAYGLIGQGAESGLERVGAPGPIPQIANPIAQIGAGLLTARLPTSRLPGALRTPVESTIIGAGGETQGTIRQPLLGRRTEDLLGAEPQLARQGIDIGAEPSRLAPDVPVGPRAEGVLGEIQRPAASVEAPPRPSTAIAATTGEPFSARLYRGVSEADAVREPRRAEYWTTNQRLASAYAGAPDDLRSGARVNMIDASFENPVVLDSKYSPDTKGLLGISHDELVNYSRLTNGDAMLDRALEDAALRRGHDAIVFREGEGSFAASAQGGSVVDLRPLRPAASVEAPPARAIPDAAAGGRPPEPDYPPPARPGITNTPEIESAVRATDDLRARVTSIVERAHAGEAGPVEVVAARAALDDAAEVERAARVKQTEKFLQTEMDDVLERARDACRRLP